MDIFNEIDTISKLSDLTLGNKHKLFEKLFDNKIQEKLFFIIRLDGKGFSKRIKRWKCEKPFDINFYEAMKFTSENILKEIPDIKLVWTGSDEISLVFKNTPVENAWYNKRINKILSLTASMATAWFNIKAINLGINNIKENPGFFDARITAFNNANDLLNNVIWRQNDCIKNSIASFSREFFKEKELTHKNQIEQLKMIESVGHSWDNELVNWAKYGTLFYKDSITKTNFETNEQYQRTVIKSSSEKLDSNLFKIYLNETNI